MSNELEQLEFKLEYRNMQEKLEKVSTESMNYLIGPRL
jgi:hypothetical protein